MTTLSSTLTRPWLALGRSGSAALRLVGSGRHLAIARAALREPFFHFLLLGAALFAVNEYLESRANYAHITISRAQVQSVIDNYRQQYGAAPTTVQLNALLDSLVRQEVFYHEALRLKLDQDDEIIRRRLVQKYEFLQQDLGIAKEPTEQQLAAYFRTHLDQYRLPEKVSFSHVYFSPDLRGEAAARAAAEQERGNLDAAGITRAPERGDGFPGLYDYAALSDVQVGRLFGNAGLAQQVFQQPLNRWVGPLRSGYGWHLVYVNGKQAAAVPPFAEIRDAVRRDYLEAQRSRRNAEAVEKLKQRFSIVVEK